LTIYRLKTELCLVYLFYRELGIQEDWAPLEPEWCRSLDIVTPWRSVYLPAMCGSVYTANFALRNKLWNNTQGFMVFFCHRQANFLKYKLYQ
jgi:hypothetical protein